MRLLGVSPAGSVSAAVCQQHTAVATGDPRPNPQTGRFDVRLNTPFGVASVAPCGLLLHIRAGIHRVPHLSCVRRGRRRFPIGNRQSNRVNHNHLPAHFLSIAHGCCRSSAPYPVVDSQYAVGVVHQKAVAIQHTIFVTVPADIDNRIC